MIKILDAELLAGDSGGWRFYQHGISFSVQYPLSVSQYGRVKQNRTNRRSKCVKKGARHSEVPGLT